jgi:hypothetical protein
VAEKRVNITQSGRQLCIDSSPTIDNGDWVLWQFPELPATQLGFVFFESAFGPFHSLRSRSNMEVLANGNIGGASASSYGYTAIIIEPGKDDPVATGTGFIINIATQVTTAPEIFVTYHSVSKNLTVSPNPVSLHPGDTATWYFLGLPAGAFADFWFLDSDGTSGPFLNFYACNGGGLVTVRASGTGFMANAAWRKTFSYRIEIRDSEGCRLAVHDPAIDNLGPPPMS